MEASTTIGSMLRAGMIFVPSYQRAYSWDTETQESKSPKQVNVFLSDLEDYAKSSSKTPYYFGHFLFEEKNRDTFGVIDGQQRLTTIIILISALFRRLQTLRNSDLHVEEREIMEDMVKRNSKYRFETVDYDAQLFNDYVVDGTKTDNNGLETESARRIVKAYAYFVARLSDKDEDELKKLMYIVRDASCTTHIVKEESEAIQMFIFQNNRGKRPSNLEIIKAQFMFNVHLYAGDEKDSLIKEIKNRFEKIYKSISTIEYRISEDSVLVYTQRVYFNSLSEANALDRINKLLSEQNPIAFIKGFTQSLSESFEFLTLFFEKDEKVNQSIHSLVSLGGIGIVFPFIIKAYKFNLPVDQINRLCSALESIILRHRLIRTRADLTARLNGVYQNFTRDKNDIVRHIEWMKVAEPGRFAYWNNAALINAIQYGVDHSTAKYILWKYENYLLKQGKAGYLTRRFGDIESPALEHIAPQTPTNGQPVAAGYPEYDDDFKNHYLDCFGNYLLLSTSHNSSIGNIPFADKRSSYNHLEQQREIQAMTDTNNPVWSKDLIQKRKEKIVDFILSNV